MPPDMMQLFQPNTPAPQNPGMGQLNPGILQLIQSVLTSLPDRPTPNMGNSGGAMAVPSMARAMTPEEDFMNMLVGMLNNSNPEAQMNAAGQGIGGMAFGGLGGRPRGT